jgi:hypothetical protein
MILSNRIVWGLLVAGLAAAVSPAARGSVFTVREVHSASDPIDSLSKATQLLSGTVASSRETSGSALVVNYVDPQSASRGRFGGDVTTPSDSAFPGNGAGDDNDFVLYTEANVVIPTAGAWTFGVNADNGVRVRVGSFVMSRSGFDTSTLLTTFAFPSAGTYPLTMTYYEHTGQSGIELFAAPGTVTSGSDASLRLIGDVANGGLALAPEPTGVMPLALLAALLVRRWSRV